MIAWRPVKDRKISAMKENVKNPIEALTIERTAKYRLYLLASTSLIKSSPTAALELMVQLMKGAFIC
jgi:hypothetical protein